MKKAIYLLLATAAVVIFAGCPPQAPSVEAAILAFDFKAADNVDIDSDISGTIDGNLITVNVPDGTDITALVPAITISDGASISPAAATAADFSNSVTYTVTAEDGTTNSTYVIAVNAGPWSCDAGMKFTACIGTYSLDGSLFGNTAGVSYSWYTDEAFTPALDDSNSLKPSFEVTPEVEDGIYDFVLRSNNGNVIVSDSVSVTINISDKLTASDGTTGDLFGKAVVSSDGSTVAVRACGNDIVGGYIGSVYIYRDDGSTWNETKLNASDGELIDKFGCSVSVSSDGLTVAVGAYRDDDNGNNSGSVYIYKYDGRSWNETKLNASDGARDDNFGGSVSISSDGSTVAVGAPSDGGTGLPSGSVYIYKYDGSSWNETKKLTASDSAELDHFGGSVSISSDGLIVAVGVYRDEDNGYQSGSVYIYSYDGSNWNEKKLTASDGAEEDYFGESVSVSSDGSIVAVSATGDDDRGWNSGSVYIYTYDGSSWNETKLTASEGAINDRFGGTVSVSTDGSLIAVGAPWNDEKGGESGSVYIYSYDGSNWNETKLTASDGAASDYFGESVSVSSDVSIVAVSAPSDDDKGSDSGSCYLYYFKDKYWRNK